MVLFFKRLLVFYLPFWFSLASGLTMTDPSDGACTPENGSDLEGREDCSVTVETTTEFQRESGERNSENDGEELHDWVAPKYIREHFPYYVSGFDLDGRPIFVFEVGKYDYVTALAEGGEEMERILLQYWKQSYENINRVAAQHELENGLGEFAFIYDFDGFSLEYIKSNRAMRLYMKLVRNAGEAEVFNKRLSYGFFLNANYMALAALQSARPLLGAVMERIEIYGTRKEIWLPQILRRIPRDQLPPWYGGGGYDGKGNFTPAIVFG